MAMVRRQNTGETEGSARAFAATETAESHGDRDAAQKRKKDETSGVVTREHPWQSKDLLALPSRQHISAGIRAAEMKWEGSGATLPHAEQCIPLPHHCRAALRAPRASS